MCSPAIDIVTLLTDLTKAVNGTIFSSLTLRAFSRAGFEELQMGGLGQVYEEAAARLERCAEGLSATEPVAEETPTCMDNKDIDQDVPNPYDPVRLNTRAALVEKLTNEWIHATGPIDRSKSSLDSSHIRNKSAMRLLFNAVKPWVIGAGFGLLVAIFGCVRTTFSPAAWRRIIYPPYHDLPKAAWCLKFAIGFTALVCMNVYWEGFAELEIPTSDPIQGAHFAGWYLIAYGFGTTQTVEGTWKKSILRMIGTVSGGFSAWLALTACNDNPYGLGAWMTITGTAVAFSGLPQGFNSRFGLNKDFAWGPGYFAMTQSLVVAEVYWGYGGKNDTTLNRIVANCVGIGMAMLMAAIPPGVYGGSPREAKFLLEDNKRVFLKSKLEQLYATAEATFIAEFSEANDNFSDASQLQKLCILKLDPKLRLELDHMDILGSSILSLLRFSIALADIQPQGGETGDENDHRAALEGILDGLEIDDYKYHMSGFHMNHRAGEGMVHNKPKALRKDLNPRVIPAHVTFAHFCAYIYHYIVHREGNLETIQWGFFGAQKLEG
jgi:hypothetical protein